jgi:hypothetical protein
VTKQRKNMIYLLNVKSNIACALHDPHTNGGGNERETIQRRKAERLRAASQLHFQIEDFLIVGSVFILRMLSGCSNHSN